MASATTARPSPKQHSGGGGGRGPSANASSGGSSALVGNTNVYLTRPARRQTKKGTGPVRHEFQNHSTEYNIWYHKRLGDKFEQEDRTKALTRCCVASDAGYTRADRGKKDTYICIYFARGHCMHGAECSFYHRIPTDEDELRMDLTHDVFGRERHRNYREDMGGVGSFLRDNRTLYISGWKRANDIEATVTQHFAEWGELDTVRVVYDKGIAFAKYRLRCSAEFAKEAMQDQSLDAPDEVLNIRWANEDPNPTSQEQEENKTFMQLAQAVAQKKNQDDPLYHYGNEEDGNGTVDNFPSTQNPSEYPNTSEQYNQQTNYYSNSTQVISDWLKELGLAQYEHSILSYYVDLQSISQLDEIGLDAVGITNPEHRKNLLSSVNKLVPAAQQEQQQQQYQYGHFPTGYDYSAYYQNYQQHEPNQQGYYYNPEYTGADPNAYDEPTSTTAETQSDSNKTKQSQGTSQSKPQKDSEKPEKLVAYDSD